MLQRPCHLALLLIPLTSSGCLFFESGPYCYRVDATGALVQTAQLVYPDGEPAPPADSAQGRLSISAPEYVLCGGVMEGPMTLAERGIYRGHPTEGTEILLPASDEPDQGRYALGLNGLNDVFIGDLTLRTQGGGIGLLLTNTQGAIISNVSIEGPFEEGLHLEAFSGLIEDSAINLDGQGYGMGVLLGSDVALYDSTIQGVSPIGVVVTESAIWGQNLAISDVNTSGDTEDGAGVFIHLDEGPGAGGVSLEGLAISEVNGYGIYADGAALELNDATITGTSQSCVRGINGSDLDLTDVTLSECLSYGLIAQNAGGIGLSGLDIRDINSADGSLSLGILVQQDAGSVLEGDATLRDSLIEDITGPGLYVDGASVYLANTVIQRVQGYGLTLLESGGRLEGNRISEVVPFPDWSSAFGIYIPAPEAEITPALAFSGNLVEGVQTGIRVEGYNLTLTQEALREGEIGMQLLDIPSLEVTDSTIEGFSNYGLFVSESSGSVSNTLFDGNGVGIYCQGGAFSSSGNRFSGNGEDTQGCE